MITAIFLIFAAIFICALYIPTLMDGWRYMHKLEWSGLALICLLWMFLGGVGVYKLFRPDPPTVKVRCEKCHFEHNCKS